MQQAPMHPKIDSARASREDEMMSSHASQLLAAGTITQEEANRISEPWHKTGVLDIQYSREYLQQHPDYTGENAHDMPTLNQARKRHERRNMKQRKMIRDFEAGRIDRHGREAKAGGVISVGGLTSAQVDVDESEEDEEDEDIDDDDVTKDDTDHYKDDDDHDNNGSGQQSGDRADNGSDGHANDEDTKDEDQHGDTSHPSDRISAETHYQHHGSRNSLSPYQQKVPSRSSARPWAVPVALHRATQERRGLADRQAEMHKAKKIIMQTNNLLGMRTRSKKREREEDGGFPSVKFQKVEVSEEYKTAKLEQTSPSSASSSSSCLTVLTSQSRREMTMSPKPPLVIPSPGRSDYTQCSYPEILALCRKRDLSGSGNAQTIRNRLIQDDIDIEQGNKRTTTQWRRNKYKKSKKSKQSKTVASVVA